MKSLRAAYSLILGALASAHAVRASGEAPLSPEQVVVVTATRVPEPVGEALVPVVVIDRDKIERSLATDVADLLRLHAGVDIGRNGGPGQATSLFIRGTNSDHAIVLVDGVRINPGTLGAAPLQDIAPELIDRVEIVKGPRSTLYGTDAIGGVVNVITRGPDADRMQALIGYGHYRTREGFVGGALAGERGGLSLGVNWLESDGFPTLASDSLARGYRNTSVALAGRTHFEGVDLGARLWRAAGNTEYSDYFSHAPLDQDFVDSSFAVDAGAALDDHWRTHATLSRVVDDIRQQQATDFVGLTPAADFALTHRDALDWQNDLQVGPNAITVGALLTREHASTLSYGTAFDVGTRADTWYAEDQLAFGRQRIAAAAGYTHHEVFGGHGTWNAEYGYALRPGTLLTAGVGTAFRAPNSTDLYGYGGNPALRPESSRNVELGLRQRIDARQTLALAAFDNRVEQLVQFVFSPTPPDYGQLQNVDRARVRGLEASFEWRDETWRAQAEASRQNPRDTLTGATLLRRARESATLALERSAGRGLIGLDLLAVGPRSDYGDTGPVTLGGYLLVNLGARVRLPNGFTLQARLENALDKRYELARGYNTARRGLYLATRYDLR